MTLLSTHVSMIGRSARSSGSSARINASYSSPVESFLSSRLVQLLHRDGLDVTVMMR
jgi:hypothetical protein